MDDLSPLEAAILKHITQNPFAGQQELAKANEVRAELVGQLAVLLQGRYAEVNEAQARAMDWAMARRLFRHLLLRGRKEELMHLLDSRAEAILPGVQAQIGETLNGVRASG